MRNLRLEMQIVKSGIKKFRLARGMGWHAPKMSMVLNGSYDPTDKEKDKLGGLLGCMADDIFPAKSSTTLEVA